MPIQLIICVMLVPVGAYFCLLGLLHASGRAWVTTGVRDYLALVVALSGLITTGPIQVLLHSEFVPLFVSRHWWLAPTVYCLLAAVFVPRSCSTLVIYNVEESAVAAAIRRILERSVGQVQESPGAWMLVERGVRIELDPFVPLSNVVVHFRGTDRELYWRLYRELPAELSGEASNWSVPGLTLGAAGGVLIAFPMWVLAASPVDLLTLVKQIFVSS
jgi:hypothetical protein